jgi:aspartate aminotransferase
MALHIAARASGLSDALTLAINNRYKALVAAGEDAISFGTGEPDFETPDAIREAAIAAVRAGFTRYTPSSGMPPLREAVAKRLRERNGIPMDASRVIITNGAKQALYEAFHCLLDEGDELLIPSPYWLSYPEMARALGAVPVPVRCRESDGWRIDIGALEAACSPRSRVLVLNSPNNPTGAVLSREELEAVAAICKKRDLAVVSDEIYEDLVYDGAKSLSFAALGPDAAARTVTVGGVSKSYAMTGWRIGWAAGPAEVIGAMGSLQSHLTSNAASISQKAALEAVSGDQSGIATMVATFDDRRRAMIQALQAIEGTSLVAPRGAFYCFLRVDGLYGKRAGIDNSMAFCEALLEEERVACIPGSVFGTDAHVRFSYATSRENVVRGCARVAAFVGRLR